MKRKKIIEHAIAVGAILDDVESITGIIGPEGRIGIEGDAIAAARGMSIAMMELALVIQGEVPIGDPERAAAAMLAYYVREYGDEGKEG